MSLGVSENGSRIRILREKSCRSVPSNHFFDNSGKNNDFRWFSTVLTPNIHILFMSFKNVPHSFWTIFIEKRWDKSIILYSNKPLNKFRDKPILYNRVRHFFCYCSYVEENQNSSFYKTSTNDLFKTTRNETRNEIADQALRLEMRLNWHKTKHWAVPSYRWLLWSKEWGRKM